MTAEPVATTALPRRHRLFLCSTPSPPAEANKQIAYNKGKTLSKTNPPSSNERSIITLHPGKSHGAVA